MTSLEQFNYATTGPIHEEGHAIRLVRLIGGSGPEIKCDLFKSYIHEAGIPYEALSYVWGSAEKTRPVTLNDKSFWVTQNLYEALQHLRRENEDRIMWIDAICINQSHVKERNHQVMHMASIYQEAERVIFWLGTSTPYIDILMNTLKRLQRAALTKGCSSWGLEDGRWREIWSYLALGNSLQREHLAGLKSALERPWFERVWILQECAHAKTGIVACGNNYVSAQIFVLAPSLLQVSVGPHCQQVLEIMPGFRRRGLLKRQQDLVTLLRKFQHSEASEERDKIYALYSFASDSEKLPTVDYGRPLNELFADLLRIFIPFHQWQSHEVHMLSSSKTVHDFFSNLTKLNNTAMIFAAKQGKLSLLQQLCSHPESNFNFIDDQGNSTLLVAAECSNIDIIEFLLRDPNININIKGYELRTPLHRAAVKKRVEVIEYLSKSGVIHLNPRDCYGSTPLHLAVGTSDENTVSRLSSNWRTNRTIQDNNGKTPFWIAVELGENGWTQNQPSPPAGAVKRTWHKSAADPIRAYCSLVQNSLFSEVLALRNSTTHQHRFVRFLNQCNDERVVNACDQSGQTILLSAIHEGNTDVAIALLEVPKVSINIRNLNWREPFYMANMTISTEAYGLLVSNQKLNGFKKVNKYTSLTMSTKKMYTGFWNNPLKVASVEATEESYGGHTLLTLAIEKKNILFVRLLTGSTEVDVNEAAAQGITPLKLAISKGYAGLEMLEILLATGRLYIHAKKEGADSAEKTGCPALQYILSSSNQLLKSAQNEDEDLFRRDFYLKSCIISAIKSGNKSRAEFLLWLSDITIGNWNRDWNDDWTVGSSVGYQILKAAIYMNDAEMVRILLSKKHVPFRSMGANRESPHEHVVHFFNLFEQYYKPVKDELTMGE